MSMGINDSFQLYFVSLDDVIENFKLVTRVDDPSLTFIVKEISVFMPLADGGTFDAKVS